MQVYFAKIAVNIKVTYFMFIISGQTVSIRFLRIVKVVISVRYADLQLVHISVYITLKVFAFNDFYF